MASTWSDLKIQLMGSGDESGNWGNVTNDNLGTAIEEAISGTADVTFSSADVTLSLTDTTASQTARNMRLNLIGTTGGSTRNLSVPNIEKMYVVKNQCADSIIIKNATPTYTFTAAISGTTMTVSAMIGSGPILVGASISGTGVTAGTTVTALGTGTGGAGTYTVSASQTVSSTTITATGLTVTIPTNKSSIVFNDGSNIVDVASHLSSLTLGSALPAASGGTGLNTVGTAGNVLTSDGSAWISSVPTGVIPSGGIIMWSGSIASIPAGWYLCDGNNSTPDLRNKFIIGAYQDNGGVAVTTVTGSNTTTGGSAAAVTVAHTHTGTTATDGTHSHEILPFLAGSINGPGNYLQGAVNDNNYGIASTVSAGAHTHTFTTDSTGVPVSNTDNLPPYYALAYIMKA